MEPACSLSDAHCNGAATAYNQCLPEAKFGSDVLSNTSDTVHAGDVSQFSEDSDLQLAAQLGKVLLQENQELRWTNQQTIQEFNEKIEVI